MPSPPVPPASTASPPTASGAPWTPAGRPATCSASSAGAGASPRRLPTSSRMWPDGTRCCGSGPRPRSCGATTRWSWPGSMADPGAAALGLFALSDTVLASDQPPEHVLERLRQLGHSLLPEQGRGPATDAPRRARGRPAATEPSTAQVTPALAAAAVRAIRANDRSDPPDTDAGPSDAADPGLHPVPAMGPRTRSWACCGRPSPPTHRCGSGTPTPRGLPGIAGSSRCAWPAAT